MEKPEVNKVDLSRQWLIVRLTNVTPYGKFINDVVSPYETVDEDGEIRESKPEDES